MISDLYRFARKVLVTNTCWIWTASLTPKGYGQFRYKGTTRRAHRVVWELLVGKIPDGLWVLHTCDVKNCVNPDHLFLGTPLDNMRDMIEKGRDCHEAPQWGESHWDSKLTESEVLEIRSFYSIGNYRHKDLAEMFNISKETIGNIVRRETWRHI